MQIESKNWYLKKLLIFDKIYKDDNKFNDIAYNFGFEILIFFDRYIWVSLLNDAYI